MSRKALSDQHLCELCKPLLLTLMSQPNVTAGNMYPPGMEMINVTVSQCHARLEWSSKISLLPPYGDVIHTNLGQRLITTYQHCIYSSRSTGWYWTRTIADLEALLPLNYTQLKGIGSFFLDIKSNNSCQCLQVFHKYKHVPSNEICWTSLYRL